MSVGELACSYAALIFHDDAIPVTSKKISTLVKAANCWGIHFPNTNLNIESYWAGLFAKLRRKKNIEGMLLNVGAGGGGAAVAVAAPAGGAAPAAAAPVVEEKKEEPKEESDDDI